MQQVPESEIKEMFEIKDAYMINLNATGTWGHCLDIQKGLQIQTFLLILLYNSNWSPQSPGKRKDKEETLH